MSDEYTPTWLTDSESDYDSPEEYPDDFVHALDPADPPEWEPTEIGNDADVKSAQDDYKGEKRHIAITLIVPQEWGEQPEEWDVHWCDSRYRISVWLDETPAPVIDSDRTGSEIRMDVWGVRWGDVSSMPVTVTDISAAVNGGVRVDFESPPERDETLERIIEKGCLLCQEQEVGQ